MTYAGAASATVIAAMICGVLAGPSDAQTTGSAAGGSAASGASPSGAPASAAPTATPTHAPKPAQQDEDDEDEGAAPPGPDITVVARKPPPPQPGAVVGDIKPEIQLSPADVQSYGVSTVTELLEELSPETRSDRGRGGSSPVVLLNGRRISSFNEIQNIPTEAILRVDILPEEVSLKYGYTADQRVVNIVLKRHFHAITGEVYGGQTTDGGDPSGQGEVDQFRTRGDSRLNMDLKYDVAGGLTDADRDLNGSSGTVPYALGGNVTSSTAGGQIDPALSALAGQPVTVAGIPSTLGGQKPTLATFLPTANIANTTNTEADRSLVPITQSLTANAVLSRPLPENISFTVNGTLGLTTSESLQGLPGLSLTVPAGDPFSPFSGPVTVDRYVAGQGPISQTVDGWTAHLGTTLNRDVGDWRLSLTDAYDYADSITVTGVGLNANPLQALLNQSSSTFDPFAPITTGMVSGLDQSTARSISDSGNIQVLANGPLWKLPAGDLYVSAKVGDTESLQYSTSLRSGVSQMVNLARNDSNVQLNVDVPLTSRTHHVFGFIGDLSVNVNSAVDYLSDFGTLPTLGFGINWTPVPGYNLIISETHDHAAPTIQQLGGPVVETPGARIFDYGAGQTVSVTQISGGNPNLTDDNRHVYKVGLTLKPWSSQNFTFTANYINSVINNAIATFPAASAAIEAAYPNRFVRNAEGELTEEDDRPVNFAQENREEIRYGINFSMPVGKQPPPPSVDWRAFARRRAQAAGQGGGQGAAPADTSATPGAAPAGGAPGGGAQAAGGPPGGGSGSGGGGGGGGGRGSGGFGGGGRGGGFGGAQATGGRFQIAIYHTVIFKDNILVTPGGPVLDLLNGAAASSTGGQYQQEIEGQLGYTLNGYGLRISADWRSATQVDGGGGASTGNLYFSDVTTINLRLWDNFAQQREVVAKFPLLRGTRLTLNMTNLFNDRVDVRDTAGPPPLAYQPDYTNPQGRAFSISLRKLFY
jgi:hypothetical protein